MITSATQALTEDPILIENNAHVNNERYSDEGEKMEEANQQAVDDQNTQKVEIEPDLETEPNLEQESVAEERWQGVVFGESTSASKYQIESTDNSVRLSSTNNGGKFQSSGSDGITYYYHPVSKETNFSLKATIEIESWTYTNAQEGFAVMVRDSVPKSNLFGQSFYSNSFSLLGSRIEYLWNSDTKEVVSGNGSKYTMRLGLGSRTITGISPDSPESAPAPGSVKVETAPMETSAGLQEKEASSYNIFGNGNGNLFPATDNLTKISVEMKKTNTGFEAYYYDSSTGKELANEIMYDWEELYGSSEEEIYVGFAAARNMTIKVDEIDLTFSDPATDPPAKERPNKIIEPIYSVTSSNYSGDANHVLSFKTNADGQLTIVNRQTNEIIGEAKDVAIQANKEQQFETKLMTGENHFTFRFTPDKNFPPEDYTVLANYDTQEIKHTVVHQQHSYSTLYVTPTGTATGSGSKQNPLSLTEALKYASGGQIIVLSSGTYALPNGLSIPKGINGTKELPIYLIAEKNKENQRPIFDFCGTGNGLTVWGNHWILRGFDITNSAAMQKGMQISGNYNVVEDIHAYRNGNTGIQISGSSNDPFEAWPAHNLIKNCTSFKNADPGFEDADGFAAKLTVGEGNLFDGCIAYHNADDGWDLFAKNETGSIGKVVIKNSVAYRNGWIPGVNGEGNGNGFKMGGSSLSGKHELINSLSFENLAKGIDSNSGTDIIVKSSTSFNNGSYNVALYTSSASETAFETSGILSFRTTGLDIREQIQLLKQEKEDVFHELNYLWNEQTKRSENHLGSQILEEWFDHLDTSDETKEPVSRYENGSINVFGLMQIKPEFRRTDGKKNNGVPLSVGAILDETSSPFSDYPVVELEKEREPNQTQPTEENNPIIIKEANGIREEAEKHITEQKPFTVWVADFAPADPLEAVKGDMRYFPVEWRIDEAGMSGAFSDSLATISAPRQGAYVLSVWYRTEIFDGMTWIKHADRVSQEKKINSLAGKTTESTTDESDKGKETGQSKENETDKNKLPTTGEKTNYFITALGVTLICAVVLYMTRKKKKA